jgi:hypothetical protein
MSSSLAGHNGAVVPFRLSRSKAIKHLKQKGVGFNGIPEKKATDLLYVLFVKIGAASELPSNTKIAENFLNDFWSVLYLHNNLCPADIPFDIIINSFSTALVHGTVERKGNNQAAICQAFNEWIKRDDVRHRLYETRNRMYPNQKPKELAKDATPESVKDYTDKQIDLKILGLKPMQGIKLVDDMIKHLETEKERRTKTEEV